MKSIRFKVVSTLGLLVFLVSCASAEVPKDVAYVSTEEGVAVIDLVTLDVIKKIDVVGKGARGLGITADGKYLLTANKDTADVSVIDTSAAKVIRRIAVGKNPEFMRIHPGSGQAFVTYEPASHQGGNTVYETLQMTKDVATFIAVFATFFRITGIRYAAVSLV